MKQFAYIKKNTVYFYNDNYHILDRHIIALVESFNDNKIKVKFNGFLITFATADVKLIDEESLKQIIFEERKGVISDKDNLKIIASDKLINYFKNSSNNKPPEQTELDKNKEFLEKCFLLKLDLWLINPLV